MNPDQPQLEKSSQEPKPAALITGASEGIGAVYADRLAKRGYRLIVVARSADRLQLLARTLQEKYQTVIQPIAADLTSAAELARVEHILGTDREISLLVNNAGAAKASVLVDVTSTQLNAMISLNVTALTQLCLAVLPRFLEQRRGTIVNIGSILALHPMPLSSIYSATKAYVLQFTRALQQEVAGKNITVQLVLPSRIRTEMWQKAGSSLSKLDQRTIMSPEDLVDAALSAMEKRELITIPSLEDTTMWSTFDHARMKLFLGSQNGKPGSRYTTES